MRTRDKQRVAQMFVDGESVTMIMLTLDVPRSDIEQVLRDEIRRLSARRCEGKGKR